jgi:hypothetical protein
MLTNLEKAVYGVAAPDVRQLFLEHRASMSERILRVVQSVIDETTLTNQEAIAAWRLGMEIEFPDEDWPDDYNEQPTTKTKTIRAILDELEKLGVPQSELDTLEPSLDALTIEEPSEDV